MKYSSESYSYSVDIIKDEISWNGDIKEYKLDDTTESKKSKPKNSSEYTWSEYTSIPYNANSFIELNEYPACLPFDTFAIGKEAMSV